MGTDLAEGCFWAEPLRAPVMTPNGVDLSFVFFLQFCGMFGASQCWVKYPRLTSAYDSNLNHLSCHTACTVLYCTSSIPLLC